MKRSTMYRVGEFDVLLFETGETLAFGHDPETGCYMPMENHAALRAIKTAQDWQIADAANAAADADADEHEYNPYLLHGEELERAVARRKAGLP